VELPHDTRHTCIHSDNVSPSVYRVTVMEIGLRTLGFLQLIMRWLTLPLYFVWSLQSVRSLPLIKDPILLQSACTLAKKIRKGQVS